MNTNQDKNQAAKQQSHDIDIDQLLTGLAKSARTETAPQVDVTAAVLARLEAERSETYVFSERIWWTSTVGSLVAAGIAMMIGFQSWTELTDPAFEVLQTVQVALQ
ncbi:hypothetical protein Pla110_02480 [Polystyrenella longa]|uniref:Uncharacterized protein n=1 Tax=Polystyrenella longa TaxID=2528007 RepID=A0A518CH97_9PLAN|nr:hypothetical protein [Polystyrenella longa]QDU78544.1 hypothetical protein Pla110_02480 [Polystyrenella longa]